MNCTDATSCATCAHSLMEHAPDCTACACTAFAWPVRGWNEPSDHIAPRPPHSRAEIQAWIDSLEMREQQMLADAVEEAKAHAAIDVIELMASHVAGLARQHAANNDPKASRVARDICGRLLAVQRDMMAAGAALADAAKEAAH